MVYRQRHLIIFAKYDILITTKKSTILKKIRFLKFLTDIKNIQSYKIKKEERSVYGAGDKYEKQRTV